MIIFLDYDGVLHPDEAYLIKGRPVLRAEGKLFMWMPILESILMPYPNVSIVLATSWVRVLGFNRARDYLSPTLRARTVGATWHSSMRRHIQGFPAVDDSWFVALTRYEQIARYISRAGARVLPNWIAIDDDDHGWPEVLGNRLIATDSDLGLSCPTTQEALRSRIDELYGQDV